MWLDKLEPKLKWLAIPHLMRYIIFGSALVYVLYLFYPEVVFYLNFVPEAVLKGQVWRLITFIFIPNLGNPLLVLLSLYCYYWIGSALESVLGSFKFTFFYLVGIIAIIAVLWIFGYSISNYNTFIAQTSFLNQSMFLALAMLFPDRGILLMYFIPVKAKWAGLISLGFIVYEFIITDLSGRMLILASFLGLVLFFLPGLIRNLKDSRRRRGYQKAAESGYRGYRTGGGSPFGAGSQRGGSPFGGSSQGSAAPRTDRAEGKVQRVAFHRCHTCGITDLDNPNMTFRYCSSCNGNYEYCENHIHNHQHVE